MHGVSAPRPVHIAQSCLLCGKRCSSETDTRYILGNSVILHCPACQFLFCPVDASWNAQKLYDKQYFEGGNRLTYKSYLQDEATHRSNARRRLRSITKPVGTLLDVGCAAGFFLDEARKQGWNVHGVDVSEDIAQYAKNALSLPVTTAAFCDAAFRSNTFDVITMWDYIEHTKDPIADVRRAHGLLKDGGELLLTTADAASLFARISGKRWHIFAPKYHISYFTKHTIQAALIKAGFHDIRIQHRGSHFHLGYLAHRLRASWDASVLQKVSTLVASTRLGSIAIPLNLRDVMTVSARK